MRMHIRDKFGDIRMRGDVMNELWKFVEDAVDSLPEQSSPVAAQRKKGKKAARTRDDDDNDDDMDVDNEYRPKKAKKQKKN